MAEIARAGTAQPAKQPAQAIRHSEFSRLFNSGNAVSGSAGLAPNAADGIASTKNASLATEYVKPSRLLKFVIK